MRFPIVLLLTIPENECECKEYLTKHENKLLCTLSVSTDPQECRKLINYKYHILVTYISSDRYEEKKRTLISDIKQIIPERMYNRWVHKTVLNEIDQFNHNVNYCYIHYVINDRLTTGTPKVSCFTPAFKSYQRFQRPFDALRRQTMIDWEWIVIDDSGDDNNEHFTYLQRFAKIEPRLRVFKRAFNSGLIGEVKNEAIALCRGEYALEFDHDDTISHDFLEKACKVFDGDSELGFLFSDNVFQNERKEPTWLFGKTGSDCLSMGYAAMYMTKYEDNWHYVYRAPNMNNNTLRFLTCLPNHPRMWRRKTLLELGSYCPELPICDDFEILIRTGCKTKCARLAGAHYSQYYDSGGVSNFSWIRNAEINRLGPYFISPLSRDAFNIEKCLMDRYGEVEPINSAEPLWKRSADYVEHSINYTVNLDFTKEVFVLNCRYLLDSNVKSLCLKKSTGALVHGDKPCFEGVAYLDEVLGKTKYVSYVTFEPTRTTTAEKVRFFLRIYSSTSDRIIVCSKSERDEIMKESDLCGLTLFII